MNYFIGICFIVVGIAVALFGHQPVQDDSKGGVIYKLFAWPKAQAAIMKWPIGGALAGVGIWFIVYGAGRL